MRVRPGGSHHQKLVVLRHRGRPELDVAYVGGIDLCRNRNDDATHRGDRQSLPLASAYGPHPPWHDVQLALRGPVVGDVEAVFRERWQDPSPLSRSPLTRLRSLVHRDDTVADTLPPQTADPSPAARTPSKCCGPIRTACCAATPSPPTASAASRGGTTRRCGGPGR